MKLIDDPNCEQMCYRLYKKAAGRGLDKPTTKEYLKREFGVDGATQLEFEDFKKALAWLNTLPFAEGHGDKAPPPKVVPRPPQQQVKRKKKKFLVKRRLVANQ